MHVVTQPVKDTVVDVGQLAQDFLGLCMLVPSCLVHATSFDDSGLISSCCTAAYPCMLPLYMCADSGV